MPRLPPNCRAACMPSPSTRVYRGRKAARASLPLMPASGVWSRPPQRRIDIDAILLGLRLRLVLVVDILDRAFADQRAGQDQHPHETRRAFAGLRENRIGAVLEPRIANVVT